MSFLEHEHGIFSLVVVDCACKGKWLEGCIKEENELEEDAYTG